MKTDQLPAKAAAVVRHINELNQKGRPVLLAFGASWCGNCDKVKPILNDVGQEGRATVLLVDVDDNPEATTHFGVKNIPALMLYRGGRRIGLWIGAASRQQLDANLLDKLK